ncbi:MAG: hypothetical protein WCL61_03090, partial [bacterium]
YGNVYSSPDYGVTWTTTAMGLSVYAKVDVSYTGQYQILGHNFGSPNNIYVSTNGGANWSIKGTTSAYATNWPSISDDGSKMILANARQEIRFSNNYGDTWTTIGPAVNWEGIAISGDGTMIMGFDNSAVSKFYVSDRARYTSNFAFGTSTQLSNFTIIGNSYISDYLTIASTTATSTIYGNLFLGKNLTSTGLFSSLNFTGTSTGVNTGDESSSTIRTKLGFASSTNDGYLLATDWSTFNSKLSSFTEADPIFLAASTSFAKLTGANFSGNVGIGTTTSLQLLTVAGNQYLTGAFFDGTYASGTAGMILQSTGTSTRWVGTSTLGLSGGSSQWLTSDSDISYTSGNVSIGTSTQNGLFQVYSPEINTVVNVPTMTSNTSPSGVASCSSAYNASADCYRAFAGLTYYGWLNSGGSTGVLQYQFPVEKIVQRYSIIPWSVDNFPSRSPKTWTFEASNNGTDWVILDSRTNYTSWVSYASSDFSFTNSISYSYYRLNISENGGGGYLGVQNLGIYSGNNIPAGPALLVSSSTGQVGFNTTDLSAAQVSVVSNSLTTVGLIVQGSSLQTANLQNWQNGSGNILSTIDKNGYLGLGTSTPNSALSVIGSGSFTGNLTVAGTINDISLNMLSSTSSGMVSSAPNDATKFLRGDAIWAAIPNATYINQSNIKLLLHFNDGDNLVLDSSSNPKVGTLSPTTANRTYTANGKYEGAIHMLNKWMDDAYFYSSPNSPSDFEVQDKNFTFSYYYKMGAVNNWPIQPVINTPFFSFLGDRGTTLRIQDSNLNNIVWGSNDNLGVTDTNWHHMSINRDGPTLTIYRDGASIVSYNVGTSSLSHLDTIASKKAIVVYQDNPAYGWDGVLSDQRTFDIDELSLTIGQSVLPANGSMNAPYGSSINGLMSYDDKHTLDLLSSSLSVSSGNLGIGTSSPIQKLTVFGNQYLTGALYDSTYNPGTSGYLLQTTGTSTRWIATSTLGILSSQWS